ncbi:aldehyde dehydrogenase family protein [Aeromicrobium terrae]|uniref:Aldehyde dehydrogenase family protein n=1 Tax=Aeromicrobium terrae TaxID=2498846 RepID=A0A5C8NKH8_9ACTN|nr:aldehyde dehydrogenase family protein [Aeromicrobium terrae]TXL61331.1 aldehyde dehydrogenase family protein [Aeromicrobium terrae]
MSLADQGAAAVMRSLADREPALLVGDDWSPARSGEVRETVDPSTGSPFARYAVAGPADVDAVVAAAREAQPAWAALPVQARATCLERLADVIEEHAEEIALVDAIDAGLPVERMLGDVAGAVRALRGWRGVAETLRGEVLPDPDVLHYTRYRPFGVVAKIVAYNHPFLFAVKGSLAALVAGNTVVVKAADQTPMSALLLADLVRGVFPPGVFSVLTGDGRTGDALVTHSNVRRIGFTGSAATGRLIQRRAAEDAVRSVSLELGGKNAMIVFPDVDVPRVAHEVVKAMNLRANAGQSCGSTSRLFLHDEVHDVFVDALRQELEALTLGAAYDRAADMGPVISAQHAERVRGFIDEASTSAKLVTGGLDDRRVPDRGFFVAPTVFTDVDDQAPLATDEVFGPVIAGFRWNDRDDMLRRVNAVDHGLTASIWTRDVSEAIRTADAVESGYVWVNDSTTHYWGTPFGGWKDSGLGREESREELLGYLQLKSVHVRVDDPTTKENR